MRDVFSFVQFSDTHVAPVGCRFDKMHKPTKMLKLAVDKVNKLAKGPVAPSFVLLTGDLVNDGKRADYEHLKKILSKLEIPFYLMPGNHDCRQTMREVFTDHRYWIDDNYLHFTIDGNPLRIVAMDSTIHMSSNGELCEYRLDWLQKTLAEDTETPTILATHQPPVSVGICKMDKTKIVDGADRLKKIITETPNVVGLTCGHLHRPIDMVWGNKRLNIGISTSFHLAMNLMEEDVLAVTDEPPGFQVHVKTAESDWMTHTAFLGDFCCEQVG